ncbi:redoxin domain-containing protein [bacterium]|nr:redoxin domain-containing protein [bacterium]
MSRPGNSQGSGGGARFALARALAVAVPLLAAVVPGRSPLAAEASPAAAGQAAPSGVPDTSPGPDRAPTAVAEGPAASPVPSPDDVGMRDPEDDLAAISTRAAPRSDPGRVFALLVNGGSRPAMNYQSHVLNLRAVLAWLGRSGVAPSRITVLSSDGDDPAADLAVREMRAGAASDLLDGTRLEGSHGRPIETVSTRIEGVKLEPATRRSLERWFATRGRSLRAGDTLLLYVTDHGTRGKKGPDETRILLWGRDEWIDVRGLDALLARLPRGVRVVSLMSQCYSGGFARLGRVRARDGGELPSGAACGYFSATAERRAWGCYPENRGKENVGHSVRFLEALEATGDFPASHEIVLRRDRTPDVPLRSSDVQLEILLEQAARSKGLTLREYADRMLEEAWRDRAKWEPEIRSIDRVGRTFGIASPRSVAEVDERLEQLPALGKPLATWSRAWTASRDDLAEASLARFLAGNPQWAERVSPPAATPTSPPSPGAPATGAAAPAATPTQAGPREAALVPSAAPTATATPTALAGSPTPMAKPAATTVPPSPDGEPPAEETPTVGDVLDRAREGRELLAALEPFVRAEAGTQARIEVLRERSKLAREASYRMEVREAALLRMRAGLLSIAGRVHLAGHARPTTRAAFERLFACEDFALPLLGAPPTEATPEPEPDLPPYADDLAVAARVAPAWIGISFRPPTDDQRAAVPESAPGATAVHDVYPDSPAQVAGLEAGDVILGPPGAHFREPSQVREWTMLRPVGEPAVLDVVHEGAIVQRTILPGPHPGRFPEMPGPPEPGAIAPPLDLVALRGDVPTSLANGTPHLLFFWATWCLPCKKSLPEVLAFARERGVEVLAITDEEPATVSTFLGSGVVPVFPATVLRDPKRRTHRAYGVSGTPTFVLVDGSGKVASVSTGWSPRKGIGVPGWRWSGREEAPAAAGASRSGSAGSPPRPRPARASRRP